MRNIKKIISAALLCAIVFTLCGCNTQKNPRQATYFGYFDTVANILSFGEDSRREFSEKSSAAASLLGEYHRLFDIYNEYNGMNNLCTVNKNAGGEPIEVDARLIDFLLYAKEMYALTGGEMNVMMGSVLKLWHDARTAASKNPENAAIPKMEELRAAMAHTDISLLEIDVEKSTVRISDPAARIDVGALGKGYATEQAAKHLESLGAESYVLNIGGNIRIIGHKPDGTSWVTGVTNPFAPSSGNYSYYLKIADTSCVTSGDYERNFTVDGKKYHHIIDKDTLMPADYFSSITVITKDSGMADALSTALFSMSYEDGMALLEKIPYDVEVLWIDKSGTISKSEGLSKYDNK